MCILTVILRVITMNYSHRALINFSLFFFFFEGELLGGGMIVQAIPPPHLKYWGGGDISPPPSPPPGIDTHGGMERCTIDTTHLVQTKSIFPRSQVHSSVKLALSDVVSYFSSTFLPFEIVR